MQKFNSFQNMNVEREDAFITVTEIHLIKKNDIKNTKTFEKRPTRRNRGYSKASLLVHTIL